MRTVRQRDSNGGMNMQGDGKTGAARQERPDFDGSVKEFAAKVREGIQRVIVGISRDGVPIASASCGTRSLIVQLMTNHLQHCRDRDAEIRTVADAVTHRLDQLDKKAAP